MVEHAFIRLTEDPDRVSTVVINAEGQQVHGHAIQTLESAAALTEGRRTTVLVPGESIVTTAADVPKANPARLRQMLAFSLEDSFADDIDELLFAAGPRLDSGRLGVSVVGRQQLEAWLGRLKEAGVSPAAVCSVADGIPDTPATVNLMLEGRATTMGRYPGEAPFVLEGLSLREVWALLNARHGDDATDVKHVMIHTDHEALQTRRSEIDELRALVPSVDVRELADGCLPRLASTLVFRAGANLLQGDYAPKSNVSALIRPWYAAAGLGVALVLLSVVSMAAEYFALSRDDDDLTAQAAQICAESFSSPDLTACRGEMQRRMSVAGQQVSSGDTGFLATLAVVAEAAGSDTAIEFLDYRDGSVMVVELIVPSVEYLDAFRESVASDSRLDVNILTYTPEDSGVKGRVQIAEVGP